MTTYKIKGIYHNGRENPRMEPVADEKYETLVGSIVGCDINEIRQFKPTKFTFYDNPRYDFWNTSEILQLSRRLSDDMYELETVNTIYILEELEGEQS